MPSPASEPWEVFDDEVPLLGTRYGSTRVRMVALGLRGGGLVVVSPGAGVDDACFLALERWGKPRFLLAPNAYHNLGIPAWKARYPEAQVVAHPAAHSRLRRKLPGAGDIGDLSVLDALLPEGARLLAPPMAKQGETWLSVATGAGRAWCVCDAIVNEPSVPAFLWLLGFRARLLTNPFFKRIFLTSKDAYKGWLFAELARERPNVFISAHGSVLRGSGVAAELRRVTEIA